MVILAFKAGQVELRLVGLVLNLLVTNSPIGEFKQKYPDFAVSQSF